MMYKIVTAHEMARIEALAIQSGCSEEAFVMQAGERIAQSIREWAHQHGLAHDVAILVGAGNKGETVVLSGLSI